MSFHLLRTVRSASRNLSTVLALTAAFGVGANIVAIKPVQAERRDTKDDATYTLKRVYKTGDADKYKYTVKMSMDSPMGPLDIVQSMLMKETTKEAKDDGSTAVVISFEEAAITFNGMDIDLTTMLPTITTTRDKNGKSEVKIEGGNEEMFAQMGDQIKQLTNFGNVALPSKPIKVGDSWDVSASDVGSVGQKIAGKNTLVSVDIVKGMKVAKVKSVSDTTDAMGNTMHSEATSLIDIATGKALSLTLKGEGTTALGKMSTEMNMKVVNSDDKTDGKAPVKDSKAPVKPVSGTKKP